MDDALASKAGHPMYLFDLAISPMCMTTFDGRFVRVNRAFTQLVGYPETHLLTCTFAQFVHADDLAGSMQELAQLVEGVPLLNFENRFRTGNGMYRTLAWSALPVPDEQLIYAVAHDVTAAVQYRLLFGSNPHPMWVYDTETLRFLAVNTAAVNHYGYSEAEFLAMTILDIRPYDEQERLRQHLRMASADNRSGIWQHRKRDGMLIEVAIISESLPFDGRPARLVLANDVTEQRRAEARIREQAALLDKARDAILVCDLAHRILYWNKGAERLYGWEFTEVLGKPVDGLLYDDVASFHQAHQLLLDHGEWMGELRQHTRAGEVLTVECRWNLLHDDSGGPRAVLSINTDITERKKLEAQMVRTQRLESIGTLAGGIAHDLNNVLTPILMAADLLRMSLQEEEDREILAILESSARHGVQMVRQILAFTRGVESEQIPVAVDQIIYDLERMIRETFNRNIRIVTQVASDLTLVLGDATQIHQILLNLCVNARDAMPEGGELQISANNIVLDAPYPQPGSLQHTGAYILIQVVDTGTGIPEAIRDRIFDPFFTTKPPGHGTGFGLSTVQALVKNHGGFLNFYSEEGYGTVFRVYLPAQGLDSPDASPRVDEAAMQGNQELILLVDDEANVRMLACQTLEASGYRVLLAANGVEALVHFRAHQHEIAVVLTDIMMPEMDGLELIQELRRLVPGVTVIASSGLTAHGIVVRTATAGIRHFLDKPYNAQTLLSTVALALRGDQASR